MAYIRGNYYIWSDGERLHLWAKDGYDGWDDTIWADRDTEDGQRNSRPSGVSVPMNVVDAFVVMRFAQLLEIGALPAVIANASQGEMGRNFGGNALRRQATALNEALMPLFQQHTQIVEEPS